MSQTTQALADAIAHHRAGRLQQAKRAYDQILLDEPDAAQALHYLGVLQFQRGQHASAIELLRQAASRLSDSPDVYAHLGAVYAAAGQLEEAERTLRRAVQMMPGNAEAHTNLGIVLRQLGKVAEAIDCHRRAIESQPQFATAWNNLGKALRAQDRFEDAVSAYQKAVRLQPQFAEAHDNLGCVLKLLQRFEESVAAHRQAVQLNPAAAAFHNNLGVALKGAGRFEDAIQSFHRAAELNPQLIDTQRNLGNAYQTRGHYEAAVAAYDQAARLSPDDPAELFNLAVVHAQWGRFDLAVNYCRQILRLEPSHSASLALMANELSAAISDEEIDRLKRLLDSEATSDSEREKAAFGLGRVHDRRRLYDEAFRYYEIGNRQRNRSVPYDAAAMDRLFVQIHETFSERFFSQTLPVGSRSAQPVFIVGMPRSGTTLVEQIISSHPHAAGAGETMEISRLCDEIPKLLGSVAGFPKAMHHLTQTAAEQLARRYSQFLAEVAGDRQRITDKTPQNFLFLGVIAALFPNASIVHCRRHPLDACLSCYFQAFDHVPYSSSFEHLGRYFRQYQRLMQHWKNVLPLRLLDVDYEELVGHQEPETRRLIDFCGLSWDDRCLQFHRHDRRVETASLWQVRQPLYTHSVQRWRNYERFLAPLKSALDWNDESAVD